MVSQRSLGNVHGVVCTFLHSFGWSDWCLKLTFARNLSSLALLTDERGRHIGQILMQVRILATNKGCLALTKSKSILGSFDDTL